MFLQPPALVRKLRDELYETEIALADQRYITEEAVYQVEKARAVVVNHEARQAMLTARIERMRDNLREVELHMEAVESTLPRTRWLRVAK